MHQNELKIINLLKQSIANIDKQIMQELLNTKVICGTCIGVGSMSLRNKKFDIVIIDESTQSLEPATLIAALKTTSRIILIGDEKQLPPMLHSNNLDSNYKLSLFERLITVKKFKFHLLNIQYRMHPLIA